MREQPKLADAIIRAALQTHYGLSTIALTFLPIGNDSMSFVYRVDASDGTCYFLKVRTGTGFSPPSLVIPRFFFEQGIPHIVTPLPTTTHTLWVHVNNFALTLYPFIDARTATDTGLSPQHWHALGATLQRIHTRHLPPELQQIVRYETYIPWRREVLTALESVITYHELADPLQRELRAFWRERQDEIRPLIERSDMLANELRKASLPLVLCHADLHTWNVLLDTQEHMWIVDWDELIFAPKERDLMFVIGGIAPDLVRSHETTCFLQGYGNPNIDGRALAYYRYAWAVQEMGAYTEEVFFWPDRDEQARSDAVRAFIDLFEPGNIVAIARSSDSDLL
jgi:spectinomycin phosphotransferase